MRSDRRFRYLVTRDFKPVAYYHSVVNSNKKTDSAKALGSRVETTLHTKKKSTGLECGPVQMIKKTIASSQFSVNPGSNELIVTKLRVTM